MLWHLGLLLLLSLWRIRGLLESSKPGRRWSSLLWLLSIAKASLLLRRLLLHRSGRLLARKLLLLRGLLLLLLTRNVSESVLLSLWGIRGLLEISKTGRRRSSLLWMLSICKASLLLRGNWWLLLAWKLLLLLLRGGLLLSRKISKPVLLSLWCLSSVLEVSNIRSGWSSLLWLLDSAKASLLLLRYGSLRLLIRIGEPILFLLLAWKLLWLLLRGWLLLLLSREVSKCLLLLLGCRPGRLLLSGKTSKSLRLLCWWKVSKLLLPHRRLLLLLLLNLRNRCRKI